MAKPDNWDTLSSKDQFKIAEQLLNHTRGRLIMGQALAHAIKHMSQAEHPELSNIEDMEVLAVLFEPWFTMHMTPPDFVAIKEKLEQAYKV